MLTRREILSLSATTAALATMGTAHGMAADAASEVFHKIDDRDEPMQSGPFRPTWEGLRGYQAPQWFRDAKFGVWAHWGPQCAPEAGDWYARRMYWQGHPQYQLHLQKYGHPSTVGFKDVIRSWTAEHWDPQRLVDLYARAGARYFFAMGNHCDNFDLWHSKHQPWNSVRLGPQRDIVGGWAAAARRAGLRFGVSVHAAHAWMWLETSQGADRHGKLAGVLYDGQLEISDGVGQWWEGLDPQDLYAQNHPRSRGSDDLDSIHSQWDWKNGAALPDAAYCQTFYDRAADLINQHQPDLIYFDDTALPLWPVSDAGLRAAAHYYNDSVRRSGGELDVVLFGKVLDADQRQCLTWDIERGVSHVIEPLPWQTCTCLGGWHYDRSLYERNGYKTPGTVIRMLVDVVSKNGNLLLSVPVRGDGTIDEREEAIVGEIGRWIAANGEALFDTRPWQVFGEGPALADAGARKAEAYNETKGQPLSAQDIRFTTKEKTLYAILMGAPSEDVQIRSLGRKARLLNGGVSAITLLGSDERLQWSQGDEALTIARPKSAVSEHAVAFKINLA